MQRNQSQKVVWFRRVVSKVRISQSTLLVVLIVLTVPAFVLERRPNEVYVHYANTDKRLDEWVSERVVRVTHVKGPIQSAPSHTNGTSNKRKRSASVGEQAEENGDDVVGKELKLSEEEYDIEHHKQITAKRNFDKVNFGKWQIKTW